MYRSKTTNNNVQIKIIIIFVFRRLKGTQISSLLHFCFVLNGLFFVFLIFFAKQQFSFFFHLFSSLYRQHIQQYNNLDLMIITKSYCHNVLVSVSTFLDFEKLVSFFCFFFLSFSWYCCTKSGGEKERKNILLGPSILKKTVQRWW